MNVWWQLGTYHANERTFEIQAFVDLSFEVPTSLLVTISPKGCENHRASADAVEEVIQKQIAEHLHAYAITKLAERKMGFNNGKL